MDAFVEITGTGLRYAGYALLPLLLLPLIVLAVPKPLKGLVSFLSKLLDRISGFAMGFAVAAAFLIILIQLAAVLLRYVFGLSFSWLNDSVIFSFAMIFMLGAAATLREDGHVRVDIMRTRFGERTRAGIELFGAMAFIFPIGILILYAGSGLIARTWLDLEPFNESDGLPIQYLFKTLVPLFAVLMIGQGLSQALKAALTLRGLKSAEAPPHAHGGTV
jgi:TRAP-type mannitol/chloroaromatic compound transport system permease small subunit